MKSIFRGKYYIDVSFEIELPLVHTYTNNNLLVLHISSSCFYKYIFLYATIVGSHQEDETKILLLG